jgi:ABC-type cobalamin/Fe3+-siderophores transport system ATPase subunit
MAELLRAIDLTFAYDDRAALRGVSVSISTGEVVALIGPNGSGKSTLIHSLLRHLPATGSIALDGRPIEQLQRREIARRVAYLAQSPAYEPGQTVLDVLRVGRAPYWAAFGLESPRDEDVVRGIRRQLALDDLLHRSMDELSGGQRQRVFIGRCLVQQPALLLLDEPDTYLDLRHQVELGRTIRALAKDHGMGVLWASHDLNHAAAFADRLLLMNDGTIAADGTASEVLRADLLSDVYGVALECLGRPDGEPPIVIPRAAGR